jgi:hypothetical protein
MATGFPVKANYATGDILTATNMNDLAGTVNLLTSSTLSVAAGKNPVINGAFDIWQRGTTASNPTSTGTSLIADRWNYYRPAGFTTGITMSRQATGDTTNLPFIQYCARVQRAASNTSTQNLILAQNFETTNSIPFAGKTVTLSFYARAGANFSAASSILNAQVVAGTGTDENIISGLTGSTQALTLNAILTTTWQRFTISGSIASNFTQLVPYFQYTPVGTAGTADYFEITGIQLEVGSTATSFARNGATLQAELAACQRYYYRVSANANENYCFFAFGVASSTTNVKALVQPKTSLRTYPTAVEYGGTIIATTGDGNNYTITSITVDAYGSQYPSFNFVVASGLTAARPYNIRAENSSTAYIGYSAEL